MKERLTGAIILVALIVLLAPELLTGPVRSTPRAAAPPPPAGEPPLRSYTIDLADESHARGSAPATSGPQQPEPLANAATAATSPVAARTSLRGMCPRRQMLVPRIESFDPECILKGLTTGTIV